MTSERFNLPREHVFVGAVVGNARQHARVGRERNRGKRPPLDLKSIDQFGGDMLRIGCAAAVAEGENLSARLERTADECGGCLDCARGLPESRLMRLDGFSEDGSIRVTSAPAPR